LKNYNQAPMIIIEYTKGLVDNGMCQESVRLLRAHHGNCWMHL